MSRKKIFLILAELFFAAGFLIFQILDCALTLHQVPDSFGHLAAVFDGSWDADSHSFSVNGPDPRLIFSEPGRPVSDLLLEVRPEGAEQIQVQVFYSRDDIFREEDSALRYVQPGDGAVRFVFPSDNWSQIRVDISQNADILQAELFCNQPLRLAEAFFASGALALPLFLIYRRKWLANRADRSIRPGHTGGLLRGVWGSRGGVFSSSGSSRILAYDVLRCMALIMVIAAHGLEADLAYTEGIADGKRAVMTVLSVFFLGCNVIYLMLSGALLLKPCKETAAAFYKKRLLRVVLPMGVYYLICLGFDGQLSFRIPEDLFYAIRDLLTGNTPAAPHYWLLFVLLSFYGSVSAVHDCLSQLPKTHSALRHPVCRNDRGTVFPALGNFSWHFLVYRLLGRHCHDRVLAGTAGNQTLPGMDSGCRQYLLCDYGSNIHPYTGLFFLDLQLRTAERAGHGRSVHCPLELQQYFRPTAPPA